MKAYKKLLPILLLRPLNPDMLARLNADLLRCHQSPMDAHRLLLPPCMPTFILRNHCRHLMAGVILLLLFIPLAAGCTSKKESAPSATTAPAQEAQAEQTATNQEAPAEAPAEETSTDQATTAPAQEAQSEATATNQDTAAPAQEAQAEQTAANQETPAEPQPEETATAASSPGISEDGSYTSAEDVALYLHTYGRLPDNYITKKEAQDAGWVSSKGNLAEVCPGKSIGGDRFGNREGLLPDAQGRTWYECDINYEGGTRGPERIVFSNDGLVYYTGDHYASFTQLY